MRTIIQHIGPLYGEANTGTVFGQPNGSIAVGQSYAPDPTPSPSPGVTDLWTISYNTASDVMVNEYRRGSTWYFYSCNGSVEQKSPLCAIALNSTISDTSAHMQLQLSTSQTFDSLLITFNGTAGDFSSLPSTSHINARTTSGEVYYLRLALFDSAGNDLGQYSNILKFTAV